MQQPPIARPSFRRILTSAVAAPLIVMSLLAGALLWQINSYRAATRAVINSDRTIAQANLLLRLLVDSETGLRGYLLTGVNDFLNPYNQAYPEIDTLGQNLNTRVADDPEQAGRIKQVLQDYGQWQAFAERELQLRREGGDYTSLVASGTGKRIMDGIRAQMSAFIQSEEHLRDMRAENAQQMTQIVIFTGLTLALIVGALLAFFSRRQLVMLSRSYNRAFALAAEHAAQVAEQLVVTGGEDPVVELEVGGQVRSGVLDSGDHRLVCLADPGDLRCRRA